ncbi:MAG: LacI family transcriptional regulator [Brachybacterium sp.]|uniref:LacI family DNA-binding transcriptional regulator n=1 Tax=Brachybacterium sp. TaxID=1891286 RepID=UPI002648AA04|nr:LacI family DNA-binding transcriptional regulator [Brachybacterium sp.]MDN5686771.1 LacI family transcriptional regulator [Brachybacterium sp.]
MEKQRPTIRQVANLAGVSHQTVSRFLRSDGGLMPETSARVRAAVEELDYRPNLIARAMRTRRTGILAIVVPGWSGAERTMAAAAEEARASGYRVEVVVAVGEDPTELGSRTRDLLDAGLVDGVLSFTPVPTPVALPLGGILVQAGEYDVSLRADDAVADDISTMERLVEDLAELGHRHLLHVAGPLNWRSARCRLTGYRQAVSRLGLISHGEPEGDWVPEHGAATMASLPDDSPVTAIVAGSDHIAMGVIRMAGERGWGVPDRLSVTGWDDLWLSRWVNPALSTVSVDRESAGRYAMQRLVAAVRDEPSPEAPRGPLTCIELRETTGHPPWTDTPVEGLR